MKFKNVLLASDFDGTLKNDDGIITDDVIKAIRYFMKEGGIFTVCTGRCYQGFHLYSEEYINGPVLLSNGAASYDYKNEKLIFNEGLEQECFEPIREISKKHPTAGIEMYPFGTESVYSIHLTPVSEQHFTSQGMNFKEISDPTEAVLPFTKVMIAAHGCSKEVQALLDNYPEINYLKTTGDYVEILKKGVDKGFGLLKLAEMLGCDKKDVYAAGDGYNDVDMLVASAGGFVPENGSKEALSVAKFVTRSNNEGCIAHAIEILDEIYS